MVESPKQTKNQWHNTVFVTIMILALVHHWYTDLYTANSFSKIRLFPAVGISFAATIQPRHTPFETLPNAPFPITSKGISSVLGRLLCITN